MRVNEMNAIYSAYEDLNIEVIRAQRLAELEQVARYRALRLAQYKAWADPVQREQIKAGLAQGEAQAREKMAGTTVYLRPKLRLEEMIDIVPVHKDKPKRGWWARLFGRS